jgi:hypothetical protein
MKLTSFWLDTSGPFTGAGAGQVRRLSDQGRPDRLFCGAGASDGDDHG